MSNNTIIQTRTRRVELKDVNLPSDEEESDDEEYKASTDSENEKDIDSKQDEAKDKKRKKATEKKKSVTKKTKQNKNDSVKDVNEEDEEEEEDEDEESGSEDEEKDEKTEKSTFKEDLKTKSLDDLLKIETPSSTTDVKKDTTTPTAPTQNKVILEFAGEKIEKIVNVNINKPKPSAGFKAKPMAGKGGLGDILSNLNNNKPKKLTTLEKSQLDWDKYKDSNLMEKNDLEKQSKNGYLEKQSFLARTDQAQYNNIKSINSTPKQQ